MKSLKRRFDNISNKNTYWSSYICFAESIKRQNFNKETLQIWFNKLVDKDDYARSDKKVILEHLYALSSSKT